MSNTTNQIAITGSIGSGKSTVADFFCRWGSKLIDFDLIARDILTKDVCLQQDLIKLFGAQICRPDGSLDRFAIRSIIFADRKLKLKLEELLHPLIWQEAANQSLKLQQANFTSISIIIPLLFESASTALKFKATILVSSPRDSCIQRVCSRDSCTKALAAKIFDSQMSQEEKALKANFIIYNNSDLNSLEIKSREVFNLINNPGFCLSRA